MEYTMRIHKEDKAIEVRNEGNSYKLRLLNSKLFEQKS